MKSIKRILALTLALMFVFCLSACDSISLPKENHTCVATVNGKTAILVYTYAYAITDTVTYTVEGTDIVGEYNLAAYLAFAGTQGDALTNLVKALWQYSDAAKAYNA